MSKVDELVLKLAQVYVHPHIAMYDSHPVQVKGYWREAVDKFREALSHARYESTGLTAGKDVRTGQFVVHDGHIFQVVDATPRGLGLGIPDEAKTYRLAVQGVTTPRLTEIDVRGSEPVKTVRVKGAAKRALNVLMSIGYPQPGQESRKRFYPQRGWEAPAERYRGG